MVTGMVATVSCMQRRSFEEEPTERQIEVAKFEGWDTMVMMTRKERRCAADAGGKEAGDAGIGAVRRNDSVQ